jgi:hypothetical protein
MPILTVRRRTFGITNSVDRRQWGEATVRLGARHYSSIRSRAFSRLTAVEELGRPFAGGCLLVAQNGSDLDLERLPEFTQDRTLVGRQSARL